MVSKIINYFLIPIILIFLWLILTLWNYLQVNSYFTLPYQHTTNYFVKTTDTKLYAGDKITGEFTATDNYLGTISLFVETDKINEESVYKNSINFRFKEKGATSWYQTNSYHKAQFFNQTYFPFGFQVILNSLNKTYMFEIELLDSFPGYFIIYNENNPFVSKYFFPKKIILADTESLSYYLKKKISSSSRDPLIITDLILSSIIYAIPLILYIFNKVFIIFLFRHEKQASVVKRNYYQKVFILIMIFIGVIIDIFFLHHFHDYVYIVIMMIWVVSIFTKTLNFVNAFLCALFFLIFSFVLLQFNYSFAAEAMVWVYFFLIIGVLHSIVSFSREILEKKKII